MTSYYNLPEPTPTQRRFYTSLGAVVVRWNLAEGMMRSLVQRAVQNTKRVTVLVVNLGNVSLSEALTAIADDHIDDLREHMVHCARVFDALRIYRNHYVHNVTGFDSPFGSDVLASSVTAKGGALRKSEGRIKRKDLDSLQERIKALIEYQALIIAALANHRAPPLASHERPTLPDKLELNRLRLMEPRTDPRS